ncbi:MAG TPA: type II CAAX endopeptidase family protein [Phycisphaerales bacterium]|nr:type II CAAX endopeptidase family protein [Phycisphaerales bacterium]
MANGPYDPLNTETAPLEPYGNRSLTGLYPATTAAAEPTVPLMLRSFDGRSVADPGTPGRRRGYWIAALLLILVVTGMQQLQVFQQSAPPKPVPTVEPRDPEAGKQEPKLEPIGTELDQPDIAGRLMVKMSHIYGPGKERDQLVSQLSEQVTPSAQPHVADGVRLVPAYAEIVGKEEALAEIDALRDEVDADSGLSPEERGALGADLDALENLYVGGSEALSRVDRDRIVKRLGWQGRLALTFDRADSDPVRAPMIANGLALMLLLLLVVVGAAVMLLAGLGMFIWACVLLGSGRLRRRLDRPLPGGSMGIEILVVFLSCFAGLKILMDFVALAADAGWFGAAAKADPAGYLTPVALLLQWFILPVVVLYPRLRGYSRFRVKRALGWHRGEGFAKEIACGFAGYLACLPVYVGAVIVALVLSIIEAGIVKAISGKDPSGPVNPIGGMLAESWWVAVLVAALATVWAPIVEEVVFRGALFRQLYARIGVFAAALLSGLVFAMMHGYSPSLFPPLIVLGTGFAVIRWWRGSLVACVTAHAFHNGTLMVVMFVLFSLLK